MEDFSEISKELTKVISKQEKKDNGIFFTPKSYRKAIIDKVKEYVGDHVHTLKVLEPSFGSGEFITDIAETFAGADITGVEINDMMYETFSKEISDGTHPNIKLYNQDFIQFQTHERYNLIVGNPPYVVVKSKKVPTEFKTVTTGRPNLYCWFLYKCIGLLADEGILAFIIPNSILNTSYYEPLRKYIHQQCDILDIITMKNKKFMETDQDTIGLILRRISRTVKDTKFVVKYKERLLFNEYYDFLQDKLNKSKTLQELGFVVKTGTIVWNQVKDKLTNDPLEGKLLVYSSNFKNGTFEELKPPRNKDKPVQKKQYIKSTKTTEKGPVILMHRGYGNGPYNVNVMLVKDNINGHREFYAENHVNVIAPNTDEAKEKIEVVYKYLLSQENQEYIMKFTGNGAMSKTEIETMLPVSLDIGQLDLPSRV